ncbi:hypothetical protein V6N13_010968 [Hibiscus sabdariffa]
MVPRIFRWSVNSGDWNITPVEAADDMRQKVEDNFSEDASVGLSHLLPLKILSHALIMVELEKLRWENESSFISMGHDYDKLCDNVAVMSHTYNRDDLHISTATPAYHKDNEIPISIANTYVQEDANIPSLGGFHELEIIPVGRPLSNSDPSLCQSSNPTLEGTPGNHLDIPIAGSVANAFPTSKLRPESTSRTKPEFKSSKKEAPNSFPSNDRSLISTGMLDGLTVKYISLYWLST